MKCWITLKRNTQARLLEPWSAKLKSKALSIVWYSFLEIR